MRGFRCLVDTKERVEGLAAGKRAKLKIGPGRAGSRGSYRYTATVDSANEVEESKEKNNQTSRWVRTEYGD